MVRERDDYAVQIPLTATTASNFGLEYDSDAKGQARAGMCAFYKLSSTFRLFRTTRLDHFHCQYLY